MCSFTRSADSCSRTSRDVSFVKIDAARLACIRPCKEKGCPVGNECGEGEQCFGNTNCDRELESDMVFTLQGLTGVMEEDDENKEKK